MASIKLSGDYMVLKNAEDLFDYYKDINLLRVECSGIKRTYCKCGNVEKKIVDICPVCGNNKIYHIRYYGYYGYSAKSFKVNYNITYNKDKSIAHFNIYHVCLENDSTKKEFIVKKDIDNEVARLNKNHLEILDNSFFEKSSLSGAKEQIENLNVSEIGNFDFEEFKNEYKYFDKDFDKFNFKETYNFFTSRYFKVNDFQIYFSYLLLKERLPDFFAGTEFKDVFLTQLIINDLLNSCRNKTKVDTIISNLCLDDFKDYLNQKWFYPRGKSLPIIQYLKLNKEQKDLVKYAVGHYKMSIDKVEGFSKSLLEKSSLYGDKLETLFLGFIKSNLVIFMDKTIDEFEKRIKFLKEHKIPIDENSIKNFSVFKNIEDLKSQKYPEKNVNIISDVFYDNPLKAMKYLKSKSPLTLKQIDDLLNLIK